MDSQTQQSPSNLIEELARQIRHHRDAYYNGQPEISDEEFDALEDRLRELAPDHPVLGEVGAPPRAAAEDFRPHAKGAGSPEAEKLATQLLSMSDAFYGNGARGSDAREYRATYRRLVEIDPAHPGLGQVLPPEGEDWPKARHEIPMGSLNKVNTEEELRQWALRCDELGAASGLTGLATDLMMTEKLDGLSVEIVYHDGTVEAAITRGDGDIGERITANVLRMKGVPERIHQKGRISVRGEIMLTKADATKVVALKSEIDKHFTGELSLRNTAAGLAREKERALLPGVKLLTVFLYDVEGVSGLKTEADKIALLSKLGFKTPVTATGGVDAMIEKYHQYAEGARERLDYEIDGLVIRANDLHTSTLLGELNNRPRAAVAFKFVSEAKVTTLKAIHWSTGDSGRITPIAEIDGVRLAGAMVRQASLHNVANVRALGIGIGDQVLVSRRNDVIPYVEKLVVKADPPEIAEPPSSCDVCDGLVSIEGEYLVCRNEECPARMVGRLKVWIRQLGLLDWGEKTLERFYAEKLVSEPADLYRLSVGDITKLDGFGEVSAKKLLDPLNEKRKIPIATFIAALGIEGVSLETAKLLVAAGYDTWEALEGAEADKIAAIPGLGSIKAERIVSGIAARSAEVKRLLAAGVEIIAPRQGGPLAGLSFCFSGAHSRPRKELHGLVEKNGGTVATSVTKGLKFLVLAAEDSTSSKAVKAKKLGTEILDEEGFIALLAEKGAKT